jgi:hypothetical protein
MHADLLLNSSYVLKTGALIGHTPVQHLLYSEGQGT